MGRIDEIGKQPPLEIYQECLYLYGEILKHFQKRSQMDYNDITADLRSFIMSNEEHLKEYTVRDYKALLNDRLKKGNHTIGDHDSILGDLKIEKEKQDAEDHAEKKVCKECKKEKELEFFPNVKGGKKGAMCKKCRGDKISAGHKKTDTLVDLKDRNAEINSQKLIEDSGENPEVKTELDLIRERNAKLEEELADCQAGTTTEKDMEDEDLGSGLYFIAAILKDQCSKRLYHVTDQIQAETTAAAIGSFIMKKDIKNQIIISIGYEKANQD